MRHRPAKLYLRPIIDVAMLSSIATLTAHAYLPGAPHEAIGLALAALVGGHLWLSFRKPRGVRGEPFPSFRSACRLVGALLIVDLLLLGLTGISMARHLFAITEPPLRPSAARPLHRVLSRAGLFLVGLHLGLRMPGFLAMAGLSPRRGSPSRPARLFAYLGCGMAAAYGLAAAIRRDYFRIGLASNLMAFAGSEEPLALYLLDHAAILALAVAIGTLMRRMLRQIDDFRRNKG